MLKGMYRFWSSICCHPDGVWTTLWRPKCVVHYEAQNTTTETPDFCALEVKQEGERISTVHFDHWCSQFPNTSCVFLKENVMHHSGKHAPSLTFLGHVVGIKLRTKNECTKNNKVNQFEY